MGMYIAQPNFSSAPYGAQLEPTPYVYFSNYTFDCRNGFITINGYYTPAFFRYDYTNDKITVPIGRLEVNTKR
jgi:hypothetical protein